MSSNKGLYAAGFLLGLSGCFVIALAFGQRSVEQKVRANLNRQIETHADDVEITYHKVKASFLSRKVSVNGIEFTPLKNNPKQLSLKIDSVEVSDLDTETVIRMALNSKQPTLPKSVRIGIVGMHFTPELLGEKASAFLSDFKYNELNLSIALGLRFNREAQTARLDDMGMEIAEMGKISTTWEVSHIELPTDEQLANPEEAKKLFASQARSIALHYADIKYADLGFLKRLDDYNKAKGKPSLAQSAQQIAQMMGRSPAKLSFVNEAIPKIQDFLTNGGTIALKSQPPKDPPLVELADPMGLLDPNAFASKIGLTIDVTH